MPHELDPRLYREIKQLTQKGDDLAGAGHYTNAIAAFWEAYDLVPEPKNEWQATTWILTAIGDMLYLSKDYQTAHSAFTDATECPGGMENAFIHLRLGEIAFERNDKKTALEELTKAHKIAGRKIFDGEDRKYLALVQGGTKPQAGKKRP